MKYLGILVAIVGAIILMLTWIVDSMAKDNTFLICGIVLVVGGFLAHIIINKAIKTNK